MYILNKKAFSLVEYVVLFIIIIGAFLIMRGFIQRGIFGMWAQSGQAYSYGRQYDSPRTIECGFDDQSNVWYDRNCYLSLMGNQQCQSGDIVCEEGLMNDTCSVAASNTECQQLNQ